MAIAIATGDGAAPDDARPDDGCRCPTCGEPNACALAAAGVEGAAARAGEPCWCVGLAFPPALLARATARDGGRACVCRRCLEAAEER